MIALTAFLFFLLQSSKGSIEGAVVNSATNKPIAGAQVQATRMPGGMGTTGTVATALVGGVITAAPPAGTIVRQGEGAAPVQIPPATTDANGHFVFSDLEPGTYFLRAFADGYARQEFNPRPGGTNSMTVQVTLAAGTVLKDTVFRLVPGGTVSGRVTGSGGAPLVNLEVTVLRNGYDPDGRKRLQQVGAAQTNDLGEYRLFWITPGRYYLSVAPSNRPMPGIAFFPGTSSNKYPRTFYPGVSDVSAAVLVDIQAAAELSGMDFRLVEQPTYRVRGRIVDSTTGQAPRGVSIGIVPRDPIGNAGMSMFSTPYNAADGSFELRDIPSGEYIIRAQLQFNGRFEPGQPRPIPPIATASVDVRGGDVDGVVVAFEPPVSVSGRITVDGKALPAGMRANVSLRPFVLNSPIGLPPRQPQWNPDGSFRIDQVPPGEYRVDACCVGGQNIYVKEIRLGSVDLLSHPLVVSGPIADSLEVVFGEGAGEISGTVRADSQKTPAKVSVVLIPDQRERRDLYKFTMSDAAGHFIFRTVAPGSYKVFAGADIEQNSWFDRDVLRNYEQSGTPAKVSDFGNTTLDVNLITK
ncbi:MAG: hypothetical protein DMG16_10580 [Acidobacteria bacterium]|nr:MAG: hypothetical protein DMG16_10580 [Acidobacteriota bacterium]